MRGSRIAALVVAIIALGVGMFVYIEARPQVSEGDIEDALEEIERVRASLDDVECHRPPLFGAASEDALPLDELLSRDGPFADCWEVVEQVVPDPIPLDYPPTPRFTVPVDVSRIHAPLVDMGRSESLLMHCAGLPEEVRLQARTPDRCTPYSPSNEEWLDEIGVFDERERSKRYFAHAVTLMARHAEMSNDDRFRFLVQGIAVGRDLSQGPAGISGIEKGVEIERLLGASLAHQLEARAPSPALRVELHDALQVLADGPIDAHAFVGAHGIWKAEQSRRSPDGNEEWRRYQLFAYVSLLSRFMDSCPPGISVEACTAHFPYASPSRPTAFEYGLGTRFVRDHPVGRRHAEETHAIAEYMFPLDAVRADARALQVLLRWSADKDAGTCPEVSPWVYEEEDERFYVERSATQDLYRLITAGPLPSGFYFHCSPRDVPMNP